MKYYKLNYGGTQWIECQFDNTKQQINLYDYINGKMVFIGIGLY